MRIKKKYFAILTVVLTVSQAYAITPEEINKLECKNWVNGFRSELGLSNHGTGPLSAQSQIAYCEQRMHQNYKNGLPSFATHTTKEVTDYLLEEESKKRRSTASKEDKPLLEEIRKKCGKTSAIQLSFFVDKKKGIKKTERVLELRKITHSQKKLSLDDQLFLSLMYAYLGDLYSVENPVTHSNLSKLIVLHNEKCIDLYESAFLLR